jgi:hypothetical protein
MSLPCARLKTKRGSAACGGPIAPQPPPESRRLDFSKCFRQRVIPCPSSLGTIKASLGKALWFSTKQDIPLGAARLDRDRSRR